MFYQRDVILSSDMSVAPRRILWLDPTVVILIDLTAKTLKLQQILRRDLHESLDSGESTIADQDPFNRFILTSRHTELQVQRRDRLFGIIKSIVSDEPACFDVSARAKAIRAAAAENNCTTKTVRAAILRYWQRGMKADALLPDFENCGGQGRLRIPGEKKLGRPVRYGTLPGVNVTAELAEKFELAIQRRYRTSANKTVMGAYRDLITYFLSESVRDTETGELVQVTNRKYLETGLPSYRQFLRFLNSHPLRLEFERKRKGDSAYQKDNRALTGNAVVSLAGIGSRFEIDATVLDLTCISMLNRKQHVGRPTLYIVVDVFSKMIVGFYLGFENASWVAAGLAFRNVVADKVAFCAGYGIEIVQEDWPCAGFLPAALLADRGEMASKKGNAFSNMTGIRLELARPYRGDMKGTVEQSINRVQSLLRADIPGRVTKNHREKGDKDYRKTSALNVKEVNKIIIEIVLYLNNTKSMPKYPLSSEMIVDDVKPVPRDIWQWAAKTRRSRLTKTDVRSISVAFLPTAKASVSKSGITYEGLTYLTSRGVADQWHEQARRDGNKTVTISYNPGDTSEIYVHTPLGPNKWEVATLHANSIAYKGLDWADVQVLRSSAKAFLKDYQLEEADKHREMQLNIDAGVKAAKNDGSEDAVSLHGGPKAKTEELASERGARAPRAAPKLPASKLTSAGSNGAVRETPLLDTLGGNSF